MRRTALLSTLLMLALPAVASADMLDDVISRGELRCAVTLDFPPNGMRDADNAPIGFDVDTCKDLAAALGVTATVVETPLPDRIPAIVSGRADIAIAGTSDTLERAKTVGFTIPYFAFTFEVIANKGSGIESYDQFKGKRVGAVSGTTDALALKKDIDSWGSGTLRIYQTQADVFLALSQGQIDGAVVTNTLAQDAIKSGKYPNLTVGKIAPWPVDYVSIVAPRSEVAFINYMNLFINQQRRTGRFAELFKKWVGGEVPDLTVAGVYR